MRFLRLITPLLFLLNAASANAFSLPIPYCHGTCDLTYKVYRADKFWNKEGSLRDAHNDFDKKETEAQLKLFITPCDTLSAKASWARTDESMNGRTMGFSDIELSWQRLLYRNGPHYLFTELIAIIPPEHDFEPAIRYGQWGGEAAARYAFAFRCRKMPGCYEIKAGYRYYNGFPSDQVRLEGVVKWNLFSRLQLKGEAKLDYGLFNGDDRSDASLFLYQPNYRLLKVKGEAVLCLTEYLSANIGYFQHIWGENVGACGGFYGGASLDF